LLTLNTYLLAGFGWQPGVSGRFPFSKVQKRFNFIFMANDKEKRENKYDDKLSIHGSFEDAIKDAISNPTRSSEYVLSEIMKAIKNRFEYEYSEDGQNITIIGLCELLPELTREEIVFAIVDTNQIEVNDSATGSIHFPAHFFK
jgi:hypothetical protein